MYFQLPYSYGHISTKHVNRSTNKAKKRCSAFSSPYTTEQGWHSGMSECDLGWIPDPASWIDFVVVLMNPRSEGFSLGSMVFSPSKKDKHINMHIHLSSKLFHVTWENNLHLH